MKKLSSLAVIFLRFTLTVFSQEASSTNAISNNPASVFSITLNETWASAWIPPASWKMVYKNPVIQSEVNLELKTPLVWPQTVRLTSWIQNPLQGSEPFNPPAGEIDYALGLNSRIFCGMMLGTEARFIDRGGPRTEVGNFGDNDLLRLRLRLDRPFKFNQGIYFITPSLVYYRFEPITYRPKTKGNTISPQLSCDWRPTSWFKITVGGGYMYDGGVNGWIPAQIISYWVNGGIKLPVAYSECWLSVGFQNFETLDHPSNRPDRNFNLVTVTASLKF